MKRTLMMTLIAVGCIGGVSPAEAGGRSPDGDCAYFYKATGERGRIIHGNAFPVVAAFAADISYIQVEAGCQLYAWDLPNFTGNSEVFGSTFFSGRPRLLPPEWQRQIVSLYCECNP